MRTQLRFNHIESRSTISLAPGMLVGGSMGFGKWEGPLSLSIYVQHNISGDLEIESQSLPIYYPELDEVIETRLRPVKTYLNWFEGGLQLAFKLR
ncbi:MAG: hypothetical protein ACKVOK_10955 [Flavobacteriales bacterium]